MKGFSLIEIVVSLFVIGIVILLGSAILRAAPLSRHAKYEGVAASIATDELETVRSLGYDNVPASGAFTDALMSELPQGAGAIAVSDFNLKTKAVTVTVSWVEAGATASSSVALSTLITSIGGLK